MGEGFRAGKGERATRAARGYYAYLEIWRLREPFCPPVRMPKRRRLDPGGGWLEPLVVVLLRGQDAPVQLRVSQYRKYSSRHCGSEVGVATVSDAAMKGRTTKASKNFRAGDYGLIYCNPTHSFTTPFVVQSPADLRGVVVDVWPEPWVLPFCIIPLGGLERQLHHDEAKKRWPFLQRRLGPTGGVSAAMNITGTTVFVPVEITSADWQLILDDLALPTSSAILN